MGPRFGQLLRTSRYSNAYIYAALGSGEVGRFGGRGHHGLSESISAPVRTPCLEQMAVLATALTHVQFSGLVRISLQLFQ